ncbi:hypothetical protein DL95DRAFT_131625 [Leptodontidium sp. 2 PMI_412]|nr:hypothetical protein DL95DRAFT_131625 [Leptodontidium sp. 2 PMI_412]
MSSVTKIAIAGFTGKMARLITNSLLTRHPNVQIHGLCRSPSKVDAKLLSNPNIKVFEADSTDPAALRRGLAGTSACICCYLGDNSLMIDGQKTLIDACIAENVPRYIASDWSIDFRPLAFGDHPSKDPMKHVQVYLEEKEKEGKIKGVHVLNGGFMEVVWAPFLGFADAKEGVFRYFGTGDEKLEMTTYADTAAFTAEVAADPNAVGFLNFLGDRKSVKEMAELYQKVYGVEPNVQRMGSLEDLHGKMTAVFKEQAANPYAWMGMYYQYWMSNGQTALERLDNERYPVVKPKDLETFLKGYTKDTVGISNQF